MFPYDDSPEHVTLTPRASAHLTALAADRGAVTILLRPDGGHVLPPGQPAPTGAVKLGDAAPSVLVAAADDHLAEWWRTRAILDMTDDEAVSVELTVLSEEELYAALAAGPLPRL